MYYVLDTRLTVSYGPFPDRGRAYEYIAQRIDTGDDTCIGAFRVKSDAAMQRTYPHVDIYPVEG